MDTLGVVGILVVGIGLLLIAAWADWRSERRAREALAAVPDRGGAMADAPTPTYVPEPTPDELPRRSPLTEDEAAALARDLATDDARILPAVLADERLATNAEPQRAIVRGPLVMVCHEGIGSLREVLPTLERAAQQKTAIVLVAPSFDTEVLDVLHINAQRGLLQGLPLAADEDTCRQLAEQTGATPAPRSDLQSGYLPHAIYGRALLVVAGLDQTVVVAPPQ
ncbi:hypothetical protein ACQB6R_11865 [Propionibacteriaceae bacterium G1746]